MKKEPEHDNFFYIAGWAMLSSIFVYLIITNVLKINIFRFMPPCVFYAATGYYCPGCGGTRAFLFLLRGEVLLSVFYHPVVPYVAVIGSVFMITQTIERLSRGKVKIAMHFRMIYLYLLLAILAIHCIWKNAVLLITGVAPM